MKQIEKNLVRVAMSFALVVALLGSTSIVNAASTGSKAINSTYGNIKGETFGITLYSQKHFESIAETTKKVPRIWADIDIKYYATGNTIITKSTGWKYDSKCAGVTVDMSKYKNALNNNTRDGFLKTKCTAYGCAEAIVKTSYTVYTSQCHLV